RSDGLGSAPGRFHGDTDAGGEHGINKTSGVPHEQPAMTREVVHHVAIVPVPIEFVKPSSSSHTLGQNGVAGNMPGEEALDCCCPLDELGALRHHAYRSDAVVDGNLPGPSTRSRQDIDVDKAGRFSLASVNPIEPAVDGELVEQRVFALDLKL